MAFVLLGGSFRIKILDNLCQVVQIFETCRESPVVLNVISCYCAHLLNTSRGLAITRFYASRSPQYLHDLHANNNMLPHRDIQSLYMLLLRDIQSLLLHKDIFSLMQLCMNTCFLRDIKTLLNYEGIYFPCPFRGKLMVTSE